MPPRLENKTNPRSSRCRHSLPLDRHPFAAAGMAPTMQRTAMKAMAVAKPQAARPVVKAATAGERPGCSGQRLGVPNRDPRRRVRVSGWGSAAGGQRLGVSGWGRSVSVGESQGCRDGPAAGTGATAPATQSLRRARRWRGGAEELRAGRVRPGAHCRIQPAAAGSGQLPPGCRTQPPGLNRSFSTPDQGSHSWKWK